MTENSIKKSSYFLMFILIYISMDTLLFGTNIEENMVNLGKYIGIVASGIFLFKLIFSNKSFGSSFVYMFAMVILIISTVIFNGGNYTVYIMKISLIIAAYLFSNIFEEDTFWKMFSDILFVLGLVSLVVYFVVSVSPNVAEHFPEAYNFLGAEYKTYYLGNILSTNLYEKNIRNMCIFREAGVYGVFLFLAIYNELIRQNEPNKKRVLVFIISILTTYSTSAYISVLFLFSLFVFKKNTGMSKLFLCFLFIFIMSVIIKNLRDSTSLVGGKIYEGVENNSFLSRLASIWTNIRIFFQNPIVGIGEYNLSERYAQISYSLFRENTNANTNTFLINFAAHGFFYGFICVYGWYNVAKVYKSQLLNLVLFFAFFLIFSGQAMAHNIIFYIIMFYGLKKRSVSYEHSIN